MRRRHWPPYSLRSYVGGARRFDQVGAWFLGELRGLGLFSHGTRVLDIGCGCGRVAYALATDAALHELQIVYIGVDVDRASIHWCERRLSPQNPRFTFYHADCYNVLAPGGVAYVSFFLYDTAETVTVRGHSAVNRQDYPTNAVAYDEAFVRELVRRADLRVI